MISEFSPKIFENFVDIFAEQSEKLVSLLDAKDGVGQFSLWPYVSAYTLDSVCVLIVVKMIFAFCVVAVLALYTNFWFKRRRLYELASRIPGPKEMPLLGHAHKFSGNTEDIMNTFDECSNFAINNNGIAKIWLGPILYFLVVDPVDLEYILKNALEKDDINRFVRDFLGNATGFAPVNIWRPRRKIMVPAFSPKILEKFVSIFTRQSQILSNLLKQRANSEKFSIWSPVCTYTLDSVGEIVFGVQINSQKNPETEILKLLAQSMHLISLRSNHIWLQPNWLFKMFPIYKEYTQCIANVHRVVDDLVLNKRESMKNEQLKIEAANALKKKDHAPIDLDTYKNQTLLEVLLESSGSGKGYSNVELREETIAFLAAGTDTSAANIAYTLKLLSMYPEIQEKVYQELYNIFGESERPALKEDVIKMQYLECVIKESLRLYPPAPIILRKITEELKLPSGRILPAGCGTVVSIWGAHRDPKYWGEDVLHFNPDRFLPENFNLEHSNSYIPFSSGPRNCIGYQYALMSVKTSLSTILRQYRILGPKADSPIPSIRVKFELMLKSVDNHEVAIERRVKSVG